MTAINSIQDFGIVVPPVRFPQHAAALGHADTLAKQ